VQDKRHLGEREREREDEMITKEGRPPQQGKMPTAGASLVVPKKIRRIAEESPTNVRSQLTLSLHTNPLSLADLTPHFPRWKCFPKVPRNMVPIVSLASYGSSYRSKPKA
jgi:hypothetical protein